MASKGNLIIFGVPPTYPATGYGYIKSENTLDGNVNLAIKSIIFRKPNLQQLKISLKIKDILGIVECLFLKQLLF